MNKDVGDRQDMETYYQGINPAEVVKFEMDLKMP